MATVADVLVTKYGLDASGYTSGAGEVTTATVGMEAAMGPAVAIIAVLTAGLALAATATVGVVKGMADLAVASSKAGSELESVKMGFQAYAANAAEAEENINRLRLVAQLPGLGFKEAIQGSTRLQAVGMDARLAERSLMAFGNALSLVGGGKDDLNGIILALSQIASKGQVSAEEINQIAERVPQIREAMKAAFGTADTELLQKRGISPEAFIMGMVGALEKLPKATGGAKNAFENLQDSAFVALATIGEQVNKAIVPVLQTVSNFIDYLGSSGSLQTFAEQFGSIFKIDKDGVVSVLSYVAAFLENTPVLIQSMIVMAQQAGSSMLKTLNGMIDAINILIANPIMAGMFHTKAIPHLQDIPAMLANGVRGIDVNKRAGEIAAGFKNFTPSAASDTGPGGFKAGSGVETMQQTDYLRQIAVNTSPIPDLKRMALGGGNLGQTGVTDADMSAMRRPRGAGNNPERMIILGMGLIAMDRSGRSRRMS